MRLSIATKVFIAFASVITLFTGVLILGMYQTQITWAQIQSINQSSVPLSLILSDVQTDLKAFSLVLNERDPLILRRSLQVTRLGPSLPTTVHEKMSAAVALAEQSHEDGFGRTGLVAAVDSRRMVSTIHEDLRIFADRSQEFTQRVLAEREQDFIDDELIALQTELRDEARLLDERLTALRNDLRRATDLGLARTNELERSTLFGLAISSGIALAIAILLLLVILYTIRPLSTLTEAARRVGEGDYRPIDELPRKKVAVDEIDLLAREFNSMARSLDERNRELHAQHAQLLRSERLATIGRMTSLITHELRNPLSSINLNTEMLMDLLAEELSPEDEVMSILESITDEVDRLRDITEEYLVYARLPTPRLEEEKVEDVLQGLVDFHQWEWSQQGVEVALSIPNTAVSARVDANQLRQAVLNLVRNAVEAGGTAVKLSLHREEDHAVIEVEDNGPGIDPQMRERIFEPFFTTRSSGTGLGLAMTQQIVEEHQGTISLSTRPGRTLFTLRIPLVGH